MQKFINQLQYQLTQPLPGEAAQWKMAHVVRTRPKASTIPQNAKKAGVLALFYEKDNQPHVVLTKRTSTHPKDKHSGQMSFPGGRYEAEDLDMGHTALRETEEEIGIPRNRIQLLGALTPLYIPVSNFEVFPYVGFLDEKPHFQLQDTEVQQVVEAPMSLLQEPSTRQEIDLHINPQITLQGVPYFNVFGHVVWGATAMMLNELLEVASSN